MPKNLPKTAGRWSPIVRGKSCPAITGWIEVFPTFDAWVTVPGLSRFIDATNKEIPQS